MPIRERMSRDEAVARVSAVYEELDKRPVERDCVRRTECCRFRLTGKTPYLTAGEALVLAEALRAAGKGRMMEPADGSCPVLNPKTGGCEAYAARPFSCRTHFCAAAGGPYSRREVVDLIRKLEDVDTALLGNGAQTLPTALKEALSQPMVRGGREVHSKATPRARGRG
jgi:Fe-S-cluster containining protein